MSDFTMRKINGHMYELRFVIAMRDVWLILPAYEGRDVLSKYGVAVINVDSTALIT